MKRTRVFPIFLITFIFLAAGLPAQTQDTSESGKRDVFVILDVSGSMNIENRFNNVKDYLEKEVIGKILKTGDSLTLVEFGDRPREVLSVTLGAGTDKRPLIDAVRGLKADDNFTDIGTAMEMLFDVLSKKSDAAARQLVLFITDGKNTPPRTSPYYGKDLAVDERFRDIGQKISKGGWFLYVIGIGGETDAKKIADAVGSSVFLETDAKMSGAKVEEYARKVDDAAKVREEGAKAEAAKAKAAAEAERLLREGGLGGTLRRIAAAMGVPAIAVTAFVAALLVLLVLALAILIYRALRPIRIVISDNVMGKADSLERSLAPGAGVLLNSVDNVVPGIDGADHGVFRVERGFFGLRVRIEDEEAIAEKSPYRKKGLHPLRRNVIELANGNRVRIAVKSR
jgi:Mg-chelatase subunit ChlD